MNRIDRKFEQLKQEGRKALITFVMAGDPDLDATVDLVLAMEQGGADIVELGVPFSDPVAEGPVIQEASLRSLQNGTTLQKIFEMVKTLRKKTDMPLLLMMYINTIFRFGTERFFDLCVQCGVDGVIVPDLPFEERDEIKDASERAGVYSISIVAPTSHERVKMIAKEAKGFLFCVSTTGVTRMWKEFSTDFQEFFDTINRYSPVPAAVGFGIVTSEQAKMMKGHCDGVVVDSAVVDLVAQHKSEAAEPVKEFVASLRKVLDDNN